MRFMHLADLHIGKRVNGFSMLEDQKYVLEQVTEIAVAQNLDGVILAGDIYDKSVPAGEAVLVLDWFLTQLVGLGLSVYMISGNHDGAERLSFGSKMLTQSNVHIVSVYDGFLEPITLEDEYGPLNLYLLPFVKPIHVRKALEDKKGDKGLEDEIRTYDDAIAHVLKEAHVDGRARNVLVAHQLVTGAQRCDSEDVSVGGLDNVSAELFEDFDYVALGHIHGPQRMTRDTIRYAGTLLKYSFSECTHKKSITIVEMKEKGQVCIETIPVKPLRDMRILKGDYRTLMSPEFYKESNREDYVKIVLTDEQDIPEVMGKMRTVYHNIMMLEYDNRRTRYVVEAESATILEEKKPEEYVREFYESRNGMTMSTYQEEVVLDVMKEIWG